MIGGAVVGPLQDTVALSAVDMFCTPRTLPLLTLRNRTASPSVTTTQLWSAVPVSLHCTASPPSAVDMSWTPSTRPVPTLTNRWLPPSRRWP